MYIKTVLKCDWATVEKAEKFGILFMHMYSSYSRMSLPLQLKHCWFFLKNKHIWWSPSQQMTRSPFQVPLSSSTAEETFNDSMVL